MPLDPMIAKPFVANPFAAFQQGRDQAMQREMNQMQMEQARNEMVNAPRREAEANRQRFFTMASQILPKVPPERRAEAYGQIIQWGMANGAPMDGIPPQYTPDMDALWDAMAPAPTQPQIIKKSLPGNKVQDVRLGPNGEEIPFGEAYDRRGAPPSTTISMPPQQTAFDKESGKLYAKQADEIWKGVGKADQSDAALRTLETALASPGVYQGAGGDLMLQLKRGGMALGLNVEGVPDSELAGSIGKQLALQMRSPAGGAGMPGALSDADRQFLVASVPGLERTPEGNLKLIKYQMALNQRARDVARITDEYISKNGRLDSGFYRSLAEWSEKNPLFSESAQAGPPRPNPGDVVDGHVFLGGDPAKASSWKKK